MMYLNRDQLRTLMRHPAVDLNVEELAQVTGLDERKVRRLGTSDTHHVPPVLAQWMRDRIRSDPTGSRRPHLSEWCARDPDSNPPPLLKGYQWPAPPPRPAATPTPSAAASR